MWVNKNENIYPIDVDGTLVNWTDCDVNGPGKIEVDYYGVTKYLTPIPYIIELVKAYHKRGFYIRVHSGNGYQWAEQIVTKLKLEKYVDEIETKFGPYLDDKHIDQWTQHINVKDILHKEIV